VQNILVHPQTVRCGQNVKFDIRFGRKTVSEFDRPVTVLWVHEQAKPL